MIPAERAHLRVAAKSHPGMSGKNNEDRYAVSAFRLSQEKPVPAVLAIVSDGIGGHRAGEVAAEIAVEQISRSLASHPDLTQPVQMLYEAITTASQAIFQQSERQAQQKGMGATCACALLIGDRLYTANVGDSRIYLIRNGAIRQISTDHTWIQEAIDNGALTAEQARGHPNAHVIRRYLGSRQPVVPDLRLRLNQEESDAQAEANQGLRLQPGDELVLCSDGLTDLVHPQEILTVLDELDGEVALDRLIRMANERGGHDNITIVALKMPAGVPVGVAAPAPRRWSRSWACLGASGLLLVAALLLGGGYWYLTGGLPPLDPTRWLAPAVTATTASPSPLPTTPLPVRTTVPPPTARPTLTLTPTRSPTSAGPTPTLTPWPTSTGIGSP